MFSGRLQHLPEFKFPASTTHRLPPLKYKPRFQFFSDSHAMSSAKWIVMTKVPKNVEELRYCATLAEKAISSNTVNTISQTVFRGNSNFKRSIEIYKYCTGLSTTN
jgi:hypothetical protein